MLKLILTGLVISILMMSCSAPLYLNSAKANLVQPYATTHGTTANKSQEVAITARSLKSYTYEKRLERTLNKEQDININAKTTKVSTPEVFEPNQLQLKYASLLDVLPSSLTNVKLFESVDDWYGTRYRYGGTTKTGVDCSAFTQAVYKSAFGINLPRTAREQYQASHQISFSNLQQGDLLFFNTTGGVSHVGLYLGNNKFVHASCNKGVTVSDLDENYYAARFLGGRRILQDYYAVN